MADPVEIQGEALQLLKKIEANTRGASATIGGGAQKRTVGGGANKKDGDDKQLIKATAVALDKLGDAADFTRSRFKRLDKAIAQTIGQFNTLNRSMGGQPKVKQQIVPTVAPVVPMPEVSGKKAAEAAANATEGLTRNLLKSALPFGQFIGALVAGASALSPLLDILADSFKLQARGISGSVNNLLSFYTDAAKAGMSLGEYTALLEENSAAVVRAGSFDEFNKSMAVTANQLNKLGVFGAAAENLSAAMATNAVALGVPMANQRDAISGQVETFERLRKSTMMTADAFRDLVYDISQNENVQEELMGLAPAERATRMNALIQTASLGQQMGLTKEASLQLRDALLAQRKLTAVQRFKAAGAIRQAGALTGMGSQDTERLAMLARRKNRTAEEQAAYVQLSGQLKMGLETLQNSGNMAAENIADKLGDVLGEGGQAQVLDKAGLAALQTQAGTVANADIGKETGPIQQALGKALNVFEGMTKSPLFDLAKGIGTLIPILGALWLINGTLKTGFASLLTKGGMGGALPGATGGKGGKGGKGGRKRGIIGGIAAVPGMMGSLIGDLLVGDLGDVLSKPDTVGKAVKGPGIMSKLGSIVPKLAGNVGKFVWRVLGIGAVLGGVWGAVSEMFSGDIGAALGSETEDINIGESGWILRIGSAIMSKVGDIAAAAVRGVFTAITGFADALGIDLQEMIGGTFTNLFDKIFSFVMAGWEGVKKLIFQGWANIFGIFGENPVSDWLQGKADKATAAQEESFKSFDKLSKDGTSTLKTIGTENNRIADGQKAAAKATAERLKAETGKLNSTVHDSVDSLLTSAASGTKAIHSARAQSIKDYAEASKTDAQLKAEADAKAKGAEIKAAEVSAKVAQDAKDKISAEMAKSTAPVVATPGQTLRQNVSTQDVNTKQAADAAGAAAEDKQNQMTVVGMEQALVILQQQLDVAKAMLIAMGAKPNELDALRPISRLGRNADTAFLTNKMYTDMNVAP